MRLRRWQVTMRWLMTRIGVIATAFAILVVAARQSEKCGCGTTFLATVTILNVAIIESQVCG